MKKTTPLSLNIYTSPFHCYYLVYDRIESSDVIKQSSQAARVRAHVHIFLCLVKSENLKFVARTQSCLHAATDENNLICFRFFFSRSGWLKMLLLLLNYNFRFKFVYVDIFLLSLFEQQHIVIVGVIA